MTKVYYNEFDSNAAAWLRELINDGMIAPGGVDERSIIDVEAKDLEGYNQHHFFAGIGGWSYALRLANWRDDVSVWTASLPCQPFSLAGKQLGKQDERHLLPHFLELVKKCSPDTIFGEQVERAIGHGWLDDLQTTMETEGYAVGHCVLGAHSIGAAHIRQRLYWVAKSTGERCGEARQLIAKYQKRIADASAVDGMADSMRKQINPTNERRLHAKSCSNSVIDWVFCRDEKYRPIEPGILPLADGFPRGMVHSSDPNATQEARAMRLRGYGNAIVPTLAAEFIKSYMEFA